MFEKVFCALVVAAVICGCRSDIYYHNRAADRARNFLYENNNKLDKTDRLTGAEMNFVRYNAPVLLYSDLLGDKSRKKRQEALETDIDQICVTWLIPGRDKAYMVYGVSGARMDYWYPERLIVKKIVKPETPAMLGVVAAARSSAQNNFFQEMCAEDINLIRFTFPILCRSAFPVNFDVSGKVSREDYEKSKQAADGKLQYTLYWKTAKGNLVFTGFSGLGLANWNICFSGFVSDEELKKSTVTVVAEPTDFLKPFPEKELQDTKEMFAPEAKK